MPILWTASPSRVRLLAPTSLQIARLLRFIILRPTHFFIRAVGLPSKQPQISALRHQEGSLEAALLSQGSAATLEKAVDIMLGGGIDNPYMDSENLKKVELTGEERAKLIELLRTLPAI